MWFSAGGSRLEQNFGANNKGQITTLKQNIRNIVRFSKESIKKRVRTYIPIFSVKIMVFGMSFDRF